jgi:hypothetical protein
MTPVRVPVPGTEHWFDLEPVDFLTIDHQDTYQELLEDLREKARAEAPPPPPSANPAVAAPEPAVKLGRARLRQLQDLVLTWVLVATSHEGVVIPWEPANREPSRLPLTHWNVLNQALEDYYGPLLGQGPKASTTGTGSAGTSGESTGNLPPEPPAEPSGTPGGS